MDKFFNVGDWVVLNDILRDNSYIAPYYKNVVLEVIETWTDNIITPDGDRGDEVLLFSGKLVVSKFEKPYIKIGKEERGLFAYQFRKMKKEDWLFLNKKGEPYV